MLNNTLNDIHLVPVDFIPTAAFHDILFASGAAATWRTRGRTVDTETFARLLTDSHEANFGVIDTRREGSLVGYVGLYNYDAVSLVASVSTFFDLRLPDVPYVAARAIHEFALYVFQVVGLRKLMIETPGSHGRYVLDALEWSRVLTREGTLKSHFRLGQGYEDIEISAVWADLYLQRYAQGARVEPRELSHSAISDVAAAIANVVGVVDEELTGGHRLISDLGLDSLALLEVLDLLEAQYGCTLELGLPDDGHELTVQSLVAALEDGQMLR